MLNKKLDLSINEYKEIISELKEETKDEGLLSDFEEVEEYKKDLEELETEYEEINEKLNSVDKETLDRSIKLTSSKAQIEHFENLKAEAGSEEFKTFIDSQIKAIKDALSLQPLKNFNLPRNKKLSLQGCETSAFLKLAKHPDYVFPKVNIYEEIMKCEHLKSENKEELASKISILIYYYISKTNIEKNRAFVSNLLINFTKLNLRLEDSVTLMKSIVELANEKFVK